MGFGTRDLPESTQPPQSRPERERDSPTDRQTALPLENEKVGVGIIRPKPPVNLGLCLSLGERPHSDGRMCRVHHVHK